jgi:LPXTG-motif cell wall-anchored protein
VDGTAYDAGVDNEPHVSCEVRITFFGFDEGQTADITFTGQAPTGGGVLLHESAVPTSDDAAGGAGQDADGATRVYTVDDLGLSGVAPHPKQGYHVKVAVDSLGAPGGAKQKVLWIEPCSDTEDSEVPTAPGQLPAVPPGGQVVEPAQPAQPAVAALTPEEAAGPAVAPAEAAAAMAPTQAAAPTLAPASASNPGAAAVWAGAGLSALPHTGVDGLGALLLTGLGAVAAGGALQLARRRRLSTTS